MRWWQYRHVHRMFGWKFWAFVVGAAPLEAELEAFWSELGFVVIQGYGLTETAPIVTLNHPFGTKKGSVGKAIAGVEVKIAADGEILVRGENVTTRLLQRGRGNRARVRGRLVPHRRHRRNRRTNGQLYIRGRKKEMIVTPEGTERLPGGCRAGAQPPRRRARLRRRRRADRIGRARARGAGARSGVRCRRRRAAGERAARRSPEDPPCAGLAGAGAAADRGHAQAEAGRDSRLGDEPAPRRASSRRRPATRSRRSSPSTPAARISRRRRRSRSSG